MSVWSRGAFGLAGMAALIGSSANAATGGLGAPQSTAQGADVQFQSFGFGGELGPVAAISGQPSGKYDASTTVAAFDESVAMTPFTPTPTVRLSAKGLTAHVVASGFGVDSRSSEGDASVADAKLTMKLGSVTTATPFLTLSARGLASSASYVDVVPHASYAVGKATIGALTITGALVGGATLSYSGDPPANTVIYDTPFVTITLNRQMKVGVISCSPKCIFQVSHIDVAAVDVEFHKVILAGKPVTGDIVLADASAQ